MSDNENYIEAYFSNELNEIEKKQFENRCIQNELFAKEVAFYITSREAIREKLLTQKKLEWLALEKENLDAEKAPVKSLPVRKWLAYAAAACLIISLTLYFLRPAQTPQQLAGKYIKDHFLKFSQTMNAAPDSLQKGIAAYNKKEYATALAIFEKIHQSHPENGEAIKFTGHVYLAEGNYDKALVYFDKLASMKALYSNPGIFLKAITLLKRSKPGDEELAKILLQQVVSMKGDGHRDAEAWLKKW